MTPKAIVDAAARLKAEDDQASTARNSLLITLSGGHSQQKQREALADLRLVIREVLRDGEPLHPFGDAA